jgi:DNA-binding NarL/FixJ family response regulator
MTENNADNAPLETYARNMVSVLLVDDHAMEDTEFVVVGEAANGQEALTAATQVEPRLILLDIRMAGGDGLDALVALKQQHPQTAVVMLTTYDNPTYMARAVAGGAAGYLLKGVDREEMLRALRAVMGGELLLSPKDLVHSLRNVSEAGTASGDLIVPLTDREQEVLRLVATGLSNKDIAAVLFVAESTIKTHVEHIIGKLGVSDRVQAAVWAARQGLMAQPS